MRKYSFNHMLLALALFDLLFVVCAVPTHALPALGLKHNWARGIKQNRQGRIKAVSDPTLCNLMRSNYQMLGDELQLQH